ncbi:hypothetical protein [Mycobacterium antarcticum]|uniref:hypothetical protein n=1 Tax=unclassified Mycolicibacterium TaxID=2636767 RepID=UPI0024E11762|nr:MULTISPECIES: hypothetical protein [unclassified Mycolicibacterium]
MGIVKHTSVEVGNPSRYAQRLEAAQRHADSEVGQDQRAVDVDVARTGATPGGDDTLWWPVTYEVVLRPVE